MKQLYPALILILISCFSAMGQNSVGINTSTPNTKAVLELVSPNNNQGFLVPRLSTTQRQAMVLTTSDRGMMVYDINLNQFWHWDGSTWKAGLGVLGETAADGDLNGTFPEVYINDDAVGTDELTDVATAGTYGDDSTILEVTIDIDGRVHTVVEKNVVVRSGNIVDASILNSDIANTTITIAKLNAEGETDKVLATDVNGDVYWEDQSAFTSSALNTDNIYIGNAAGVAQGLPVSGDVSVTDAGTAADIQLKTGVVTSIEIEDESIQSVDIMDLTVAEADIAAAAVTEQKIGDDAVTAAKINPDVAGEALIPNTTTGALDVNAGNGLLVVADSVEIDLADIDGDGIVADLVDKELDVNTDNSTLEVASDVVQVKDLGITNEKIAFQTIYAEAKISPLNPITGSNYLNRILTINDGSEVEWTTFGNSNVVVTTSSGRLTSKPLNEFFTNSLNSGSIFVGDASNNAQQLFAANANQVLVGNGTSLTSVPLLGDVNIVSPDGTVAIQDNAVQGNDIDATNNDLNIAGTQLISMTTSVVSGQAIQLAASSGGIDIGGNQGVVIDADNNNIALDAIAGSVNIDANQNTNITTTSGDIVLNSGNGVTMTGATASSFSTSAGDIDINAAGQLDLDGGTTVAIEGATGVTVRSTANDVDIVGDDNANITSLNAEVGITGATNVDIDASAGNVTINAAGVGNDVSLTAPDQVEFNATNTQVVGGTFELANGGIQVDEIVDELTVDLATPSDNKLITETALAEAIGNQAGSGLTYDALNQEIDLGGTLDQTADLVTAAGVNLQVSGVGILDVDTDTDLLGDVTLSGAAQTVTHTGATSLGVVSNTAPITIDAQGNILTLDGDQGVSVDAASNAIDVTAASGVVNVTGNQGVNIDATNNNLTLDAVAGTLVLDGNSGVNIDASTSGDVDINAIAGSVNIDGAEAAGDAVTITASNVSGGIDLAAGTGGIATVATDGDVSLTTLTTGDVILDGADDVTITGGTNVTTTATAGTATLTATAGEVDITAGTTVDINASGGNVTIDAVGAGNDILVTAPDQIEFNATNTQVVGGTFELANGGIQVDEIVDDLTVDLAAPSDNKLITETALATAIGNQAGSGLTYDAANQEIDLGGTLDQTADLVTAAGVNLQVSGPGILDVDTDADIAGDITLSGAAQSLTHTGATSLDVVSNTAPVTIDAQGNTLTLDGDQGVSVDAASNNIDVTAATGVVNVTGNQGVTVNATTNNLSLDAIAGTLVLDGNSGVDIDASASGDVTINSAAGSVSIDGAEAAGDAIAITASDVSGGIDLTAGTGGIAALATGGDVSLTTLTTGDVILDGADDVTITGGTNVTTTATAGTATLTATAGEVDITAGTTVDINASGGNVTIDAVGAGNDILVTAPDQVEFNATNTQVVGGTFELANGGIQVDEIVDDLTVDLAAPSDNKLITETALATAIGNQAGSGLTYDGGSQEIDLGGTLDQTADLVTAAGVNLQVSGLGILDVDTDADIAGDITLSGAAQSLTHTGATSLDVVSNTAPVTIDAQGNTLTLDGDQGVSVDAASNNIDVTAATGVVNVTGNQGVTVNATTNNLSLDAIAGTLVLDGNSGVDIDASTSGDVTINSAAGSVSIDGAEAASDAVAITASDVAGGIELAAGTGDIDLTTTGEVTLNGTNTQVETGSFELNSGTTVTNIQASTGGGGGGVRADGVADDNTLVTESAVREALINSVSADNGLTEGPTEGNIQLGGALTQNTTITQDGTETLTIANTGSGATTISLTSTGDFVVDGLTGDVTIDQDGLVTAGNGIDVTAGDLDVTANTNVTGNLDVNGATTLDGTTIVTDEADLNVSGTSSISMTSSEDVADAITLTTDGGITAGIGISNTTGTGAGSIQVSSTSGGVAVDAGTSISLDADATSNFTTTTGDIDINAAGELDLDGGTTVMINSAGGNIGVTAAGVGSDIVVTSPDQIELTGLNTQVVSGSFELNSGTTVTNIQASTGGGGTAVRASGTADDNTLVTEAAVREAISNFDVDNGLTNNSGTVQLGGDLIQNTTITQDNAEALNIVNAGTANTTVQLTSTGDFVVDGLTGDVTIDQDGLVTAGNGIDVTAGDLDVTANTNVTGNLDVSGATTLDGTTIVTDEADLNVSGTSSISMTSSEDVADAITLTTDGGITAGIGISNTTGTGAGSVQVSSTSGGVAVDAGTSISLDADATSNFTTTTGDIDINAAGELDLDGGTTVMINSAGGNIGVTAAGVGSDIVVTSPDQIELTGLNTQVVSGSFELNSGTTVTNIQASTGGGGGGVRASGTADDNTLVTEAAVREAISNFDVDNGLTNNSGTVQLGGDLIQNTTITQDNAEALNIVNAGTANTTVQLTSTGDFVVDGLTGDVTIDQDGAVTAGNGVAVTGGNLDVTNALDVNGATTLDQTTISTDDGAFAVSGTKGASINTTSDAAGAITLGTNGGVSETIAITNTQGTATNAIDIDATSGGVDIDGGTTVAIDGATGLSLGTAANDIDINAAGELDLDGGTTVMINSAGGNIGVTAAGVGSDIVVTSPDQIELTGLNTQVVSGSFELNSGTTVTNIQASTGGGGTAVRASGTADDNTLVTEAAVREAISNFDVDNGLTNNSGTVQLGGDLIQNTTITQDNAEALNIVNAGTANTTVQLTSTGDFVVDGLTGDVTIDQDGLVTAGNGIDVTAGDLDVTANTNVTGNLDVSGATTLDGTTIVTDEADLNVSGTSSISMTSSEDVADAITLTTDGGITAGIGISNTTGTGAGSVQVSSTSGGVAVDAGTSISLDADATSNFTTTTGDIDINAAGELDLDGGTTVMINSAGGNIGVTAAGVGSDIVVTSPDQIELTGLNTQVVSGSFELNSGTTVTNIQASTGGGGGGVRASGTADDNTLVTEAAVREAISNFDVDNGLTNNSGTVQLGGDLIQNTTITQDNAESLNIVNAGTANTTVQLTSTGDFVVDGLTGDVTIDQDGLVTAGNGVAVTGGNLDVTNDLDVDGATTLDQTTISTDDGAFAVNGTNGASINTTSDAAGAITLGTNGGVSETIAITNTQGTATNAVDIDATAGGVDIDGATGVTIDAAANQNITLTTSGAGRVIVPLADINGGTIDGVTLTGNTIDQIDNVFTIQDDVDNTKQAQFDASGILTTTTRTFTFPDASGTLALTGGSLTANRTLVSDGSGQVSSSAVTTTELGVLGGVTAGTASASKALVLDASSDVSGINSLSATSLTGTLQTAAQTNVTSLGTLTSVTVSGATTLNGAVDLGDNIADAVTITGTVQGMTTNNDIVFDEATNNLTLAVSDQGTGVATATIPDLLGVSGDILINNASQTITNKTINQVDNILTLQDDGDNTKQAQFDASGISTTTTRTFTFPDASGTLALTGGSLTANRTLVSDGSGQVSSSAVTTTELGVLGGVTAGTASASKALVLDASSDVSGINSLSATSLTGTLQTAAQTNVTSLGTLTSVTVSGATTLNGAVDLGDNIADVITIAGTVQGMTTNNDIVFAEATNNLTFAVSDQGTGVATATIPDLLGVNGDILINNASQTITNKTITQTDNILTLQDDGNNTRQAQFELGSITAGQTRTFTLPDADGTLALTSDASLQSAYFGGNTITTDATGPFEVLGTQAINLGSDANDGAISIGSSTGTGRVITIGSVTGSTDVDISGGTGGVNITASGASGMTTTAGTLDLTGENGVDITSTTSGGVSIDANTAGTVSINASNGAINIGDNAVNQPVNIGMAGDRTITIGNTTGASPIDLTAGTGNVNITQHNGGALGLELGGVLVTATATEINTLDGVTSTTAELNLLDGVTASTTEINYIDVTSPGTAEATKALVTDASLDIDLATGDLSATDVIATNKMVAGASSVDANAELFVKADASANEVFKIHNSAGANTLLQVTNRTATGTGALLEVNDGTGADAFKAYADGRVSIGYSAFPTTINQTGNATRVQGALVTDSDPDITSGAGPDYNITNADFAVNGGIAINGDMAVGGTAWVGGFTITSDRRLKSNISTMRGSLSSVRNMRGVTYNWKEGTSNAERDSLMQFGVIAQEIEEVFPELVTTHEGGLKTVNYIGLIPVLLEAIKEQQAMIESLTVALDDEKTSKEDLREALNKQQKLMEMQTQAMLSVQHENENIKSDLDQIKAMLGIKADLVNSKSIGGK